MKSLLRVSFVLLLGFGFAHAADPTMSDQQVEADCGPGNTETTVTYNQDGTKTMSQRYYCVNADNCDDECDPGYYCFQCGEYVFYCDCD